MKYFYLIMTFVCLILAPFVKISAQDSSVVYRVVKASNGQTFLLSASGSPGTVYTDIYFRIGPVYEYDSLSGISMALSKIVSAHINTELKASGRSIKYMGNVAPEQIAFHFESAPGDIDYVLALANEKIMQAKFDSTEVEKVKIEIREDIVNLGKDDSIIKEERIMSKMWGSDYKKLNPYGDEQTYTRLKTAELVSFQKKYFLPSNNTVSIMGGGLKNEVLNKLPEVFKEFRTKDFNPELIDKVIDFKQVVNTTQFITTRPGQSIVSITYQNPGARQDRDATYCAYILAKLINDKNGRIQKFLADSGLRNAVAAYTCNNFYGRFTLSAEPSGYKFLDAFGRLDQLVADIIRKDYFNQDEIEKAKKDIMSDFNDMKANDKKGYLTQVVHYRFSNDENYFASIPDSVKGVTVERMRGYISDYFADRSGVRNLTASEAVLADPADNQEYFALDESIADIKFSYDLNKTDIEVGKSKQNLKRLIQWLTINPDMHVQINGCSDQGEYSKSYDDGVLHFIDTTATFHKAMPDVIKKGYLRIEMMRAMKIAKALYEAGIAPDRITGTSMVFSSDSKETAAANRKCTVTIDKIRPHPSLYEYHFDKKKPEPAMGER